MLSRLAQVQREGGARSIALQQVRTLTRVSCPPAMTQGMGDCRRRVSTPLALALACKNRAREGEGEERAPRM